MKIICFCWLNVADVHKYSQHPICQNHVKEKHGVITTFPLQGLLKKMSMDHHHCILLFCMTPTNRWKREFWETPFTMSGCIMCTRDWSFKSNTWPVKHLNNPTRSNENLSVVLLVYSVQRALQFTLIHRCEILMVCEWKNELRLVLGSGSSY